MKVTKKIEVDEQGKVNCQISSFEAFVNLLTESPYLESLVVTVTSPSMPSSKEVCLTDHKGVFIATAPGVYAFSYTFFGEDDHSEVEVTENGGEYDVLLIPDFYK